MQFTTSDIRKWATYYGGSRHDNATSIFSDGVNVWVCGSTDSPEFPLFNPGSGAYFQDSLVKIPYNNTVPFVLEFNPHGVREWATYCGGRTPGADGASSICSDGKNVWVCGTTASPNFPLLNPGGGAYFQNTPDTAWGDAFILKFSTCSLSNLAVFPKEATICEGDSILLSASGATSFTWSPPTGLNSADMAKPIASPTVTTLYTVTGCSSSIDSVTIRVNPSPEVKACCSTTINPGESVNLTGTGIGNYLWTPSTGLSCINCPNPVASPVQNTTYTLTITNDSGCVASDTVSINVCRIFVPNVFSPNHDGYNDKLYVRSTCINSMDFCVFDRWGNKVFESQNSNNGWDGTFHGKPMTMGTYIWYLKATLFDGTSIEKKGNVALVR